MYKVSIIERRSFARVYSSTIMPTAVYPNIIGTLELNVKIKKLAL
jgi:hypothetical protein